MSMPREHYYEVQGMIEDAISQLKHQGRDLKEQLREALERIKVLEQRVSQVEGTPQQ